MSHVFVILGAGGGIGSAVAKQLKQEGHRVYACGLPGSESIQRLCSEIDVPSRAIDATSFTQVADGLKAIHEEAGAIDGVVNCVGSLCLKPAHLTDEDTYSQTIDLNLKTAFATLHGCGKLRQKTPQSVVLMASAAAQVGLANHEAIAAAKAGVIGLMRSAAASYASRAIRVNAVAPGMTETPLTFSLLANDAAKESSASMHAVGRIGQPEDIARAVVWLLDPQNSFVTGQVFGVDGGLAQVRPRMVQRAK